MKLLVGLDLLVHISLQLLFTVFQALDLLLRLIHLPLSHLQSLSQLHSSQKWDNESRVRSAATYSTHLWSCFIVAEMYLVSLVLQIELFLICLHLHLLHLALQLAVRLLQAVVVPKGKSTKRSHHISTHTCEFRLHILSLLILFVFVPVTSKLPVSFLKSSLIPVYI